MFREKIKNYLSERGISILRIEQDGDVESIVCHIAKDDNAKIEEIKEIMESELNVAVMLSDFGGFNVVIVESNNLE